MFFKIFLYSTLFICLFVPAIHSQETAKREKVLILPFRNESDTKQYVNSGIFQEIFSRSFYTFISILPVIDVPDMGKTRSLSISSSNVQDYADLEKARIIIYGSYRFYGVKTNPKIMAMLTAYDGVGRTNIFNKTYETTTATEVFDDIDTMISEVMKAALNIDVKNIAAIHFKNFRIASETYLLYINNRLIATPTNTNFSLTLKVMPETNYSIVLKQEEGDRTVLETDVRLPLNGSTNISYTGYGVIRIEEIARKDRAKSYSLSFDGKQIPENSVFSNVPTDVTHSVVLVEDLTNTIFSTNFDLYDSQYIDVRPEANGFFPLHAKLISLDYDIVTLVGQYFPFDRYFWVGAGCGLYVFADTVYQLYYVSPLIEIGYYFIGDMDRNFRLGAGLIGRANYVLSPETIPEGVSPSVFNIGVFITFDAWFLTVQPECYVYWDDSGKINGSFCIAMGVHF